MKVILFANTDWYLYNFRLSLARALRDAGHEVVLISPDGEYGPKIAAEGFRWESFPLSRKGMNPFKEMATIFRLRRFYRAERPDVAHHFTIKSVLYGSIAAHLAGVSKIINAITGLGYVFSDYRLALFLRPLIISFYRLVLHKTEVIFQNPDDIEVFKHFHLLRGARIHLIRGSGVDTDIFLPSPEPTGDPLAMITGRFLWEKGIGEFVEAAKITRKAGVRARFVLVGDTYPDNPGAVSPEQLQAWVEEGIVEWWGWRDDMHAVLPQAHIVCLPSYYPEGLPRSLIEASACGRPIVTTDTPGCREIVQKGVNGFLVPVRDANALAEALGKLIADPSLRQEMGRHGRELVKKEFSVRRVVHETLHVYNGE